MNITLISPYHGGSHQAWAEGFQRFSQHDVHILALPARFWKWRMHGGALTLSRKYLSDQQIPSQANMINNKFNKKNELILATDMLDLTTFLALTRRLTHDAPSVLYMHENQLTYPLPLDGSLGPMRRQKGERDLHYAFINFSSMLTADRILFNSQYHLDSFFDELPRFLSHFPDHNELQTIPQLLNKSKVMPVGVDFYRLEIDKKSSNGSKPPLIIWNQRWEYDKRPEKFFEALYAVAQQGIPFRLALCGQNFRRRPSEFDEAISILGEHIVHQGFASQEEYQRLLWDATVTVSTAEHEFFGIGILEAIYCHTFPILPNHLSYPELIPEQFHHTCLYSSLDGLVRKLIWALKSPTDASSIAQQLSQQVTKYDWRTLANEYDSFLERMV